MYNGDALYRITATGKKIVKSSGPNGRDTVLDFIYPGGTASVESVATHCFGGSGMKARMALRRLERHRLVEELGKAREGGYGGRF
jgi:hypothetical protein